MKLKALLGILFTAGLLASFAFAAPSGPTQATGTTTSKPPKCQTVSLHGSAMSGSVTFTVTKANKRGRSLVGQSVTLVIPQGSKVKAKACTAAGVATLTLRNLEVKHRP
jgi:hypothetical protein